MRFTDQSGNVYYGAQLNYIKADQVQTQSLFTYIDSLFAERYDNYLKFNVSSVIELPGVQTHRSQIHWLTNKEYVRFSVPDINGTRDTFYPNDWLFVHPNGDLFGIKNLDRMINYKADFLNSNINKKHPEDTHRYFTCKVVNSDSDYFQDHLLFDQLYERVMVSELNHYLDVAINTSDNTKTLITSDGVIINPNDYLVVDSGKIEFFTEKVFIDTFSKINEFNCW